MFFDGGAGGDVQHLKLLDDPYLLVARPGAFPGGPVPLARLDGAPMVTHPPICDQARVEQELARRAVRPDIVFRTVGNEAVLSMVRAGMGTALLPRLAIPGHDTRADQTISIHQLQPPLPPREIFLLWENRTHPFPARCQGHRDRRPRNRQDRGGQRTARRTEPPRSVPRPRRVSKRAVAEHPVVAGGEHRIGARAVRKFPAPRSARAAIRPAVVWHPVHLLLGHAAAAVRAR